MTGLQTELPRKRVAISCRDGRISSVPNFQTGSGTSRDWYSAITWGSFVEGKVAGWGEKLITRLNRASMLRKSRAIPLLPHTLSWRAQRQMYLTYTTAWNFRISHIALHFTDSLGLEFMYDSWLVNILFRNLRRKWKITAWLGVTSRSESCEICMFGCYKCIKFNSSCLWFFDVAFSSVREKITSIVEYKMQRKVF